MNSRTFAVIVLSYCAWIVAAPPAHASPLLEMMGSFGDGGGQQGRLLANGASAAYFNPALLTDAPTGLTAGFVVLGTRIAVELQPRGEGFDVPDLSGLSNFQHADGSRFDNYPLPTTVLQNGQVRTMGSTAARPRQARGTGNQAITYEAVGIVGHFFNERLAVGFIGYIPNGKFMTLNTFYTDEREQYTSNSLHPEMYDDRMTSLGFGVGLGYRVNRQFSLGAGSAFSLRAVADSRAYVADLGHLEDLILNVDTGVHAGVAPHFGFAWNPTSRWRITGTVHTPQQLLVQADIRFLVATGGEKSSSLKLLFDWMPWQVGLGTSVDLLRTEDSVFTLAGSAVYGRWSQYKDRHGEEPIGWYDTVTGALGARLAVSRLSFGLDAQYRPTPVPLQRGRSNYVDNNRIGAILNMEYTLPLGDTKLRFGGQLQGFWLVKRFQLKTTPPTFPDGVNRTPALVKDELPDDAQLNGRAVDGVAGLQTNNPGWPGFASKGWLTTGGVYIALTL